MDMVTKTMAAFGLAPNEIAVYREAVKHAETSPFALARATGIPRTTVYEAVAQLALKGLIELEKSDGFTKQQTKIRAKNPSMLRQMIADRRAALAKLEVDVVGILPELKGEYLKHVNGSEVKFFPGISGAAEVYTRMNSGALEAIVAWDCMMPMDAFGKEQMNKWADAENNSKRMAPYRSIAPLNDWTKHVLSYQWGRDHRYITRKEYRYIDAVGFEIHQDIHVQGNAVHIVSGVKEESWGLIINSELLAKTLKSIFEVVWQVAKPVTEELVESWGPNEFLAEEKKRKS